LTNSNELFIFQGMTALDRIISIVGSPAALAQRCGVKSSMAVTQWRKRGVPVERVLELSRLTDYRVTPHDLDPEHYPYPDDGLPVKYRVTEVLS